MERGLLEVAWEITDRCNLKCSHCYNPRKRDDLPLSLIVRVLDELQELGVRQIKFGGGEPLIRKDFYKILSATTGRKIITSFSTNGLAVTPEVVSEVKKTGIKKVQVSLDGDRATHTQLRNNPRAYDAAVNAIGLFSQAGLDVSVATTLVKPNLHCLKEVYKVCVAQKVYRWRIMKYIPTLNHALMPSIEEYRAAHDFLVKLREKSKQVDVFVAKEFDEIGLTLDNRDAQCFGGRTMLSIKANGDVTPCSYFPYAVVGNVKQQPIRKIWGMEKMIAFANDPCGNPECAYAATCKGGCKAARVFSGSKGPCDPYCWVKTS